jgi:hypothetical protein
MSRKGSRSSPSGPNILARYLNAYVHARQMSDLERPWGLGDDGLDHLWMRLQDALQHDPRYLNDLIRKDLSGDEHHRIAETLCPLIFALPLRDFPAVLAARREGAFLCFRLYPGAASCQATESQADAEHEAVGFLPEAFMSTFIEYLKVRLKLTKSLGNERIVSCGGRRRKVAINIDGPRKGFHILFLSKEPSPMEEYV